MRLTKFGHSAVRIEHEGTTVVLDPGVWSQRESVEGVDAVLITHEHVDHFHPDNLRATDAPIYTISAVAAQIRDVAPDVAERVHVVRPEESWSIGSIGVRAVGELHAVIHPELPRFDNSGYLLDVGDTTVFHPGDALTGPGVPVDVLLAPVCAPWMRVSEGVEFARGLGAARNVAIHDRVFSPEGLGIVDLQFGRFLEGAGLEYRRLADGTDL
ncbi:MBL fold metallo-hydrolase [Nocardioides sp. WV_118_6]|uniref:MBL fold metallo-hydrolase n=1 Tax=Nocardioides simplex TaxID=2045 RepID=UPI00214F68A5|nr:MBL fold metallo-hydrolase [Pimelobacter simplex]UUW91720.1 MBL fold metallo-hydrolase [Pimelobacter simplex]UUW95548.1 MBL fold metallo-hydrolase [Pimelobacter simplex]